MASTAVGFAALVVAVATVYNSVHVVEEGDVEALLVLGEMRAVLRPGLNIVPPFVSDTYPIDTATMTVERGEGGFDVPQEFRDEVRYRGGGA